MIRSTLSGWARTPVRDQRGSLSVEQVIITVALIGIAVALVAVIANAVTSR